jgi:hypothetical protein
VSSIPDGVSPYPLSLPIRRPLCSLIITTRDAPGRDLYTEALISHLWGWILRIAVYARWIFTFDFGKS